MVIGYYDKFTIVFLIFKNNCINSLDRAKKSVIIKTEFRIKQANFETKPKLAGKHRQPAGLILGNIVSKQSEDFERHENK